MLKVVLDPYNQKTDYIYYLAECIFHACSVDPFTSRSEKCLVVAPDCASWPTTSLAPPAAVNNSFPLSYAPPTFVPLTLWSFIPIENFPGVVHLQYSEAATLLGWDEKFKEETEEATDTVPQRH